MTIIIASFHWTCNYVPGAVFKSLLIHLISRLIFFLSIGWLIGLKSQKLSKWWSRNLHLNSLTSESELFVMKSKYHPGDSLPIRTWGILAGGFPSYTWVVHLAAFLLPILVGPRWPGCSFYMWIATGKRMWVRPHPFGLPWLFIPHSTPHELAELVFKLSGSFGVCNGISDLRRYTWNCTLYGCVPIAQRKSPPKDKPFT